jgi:hypothetical protein
LWVVGVVWVVRHLELLPGELLDKTFHEDEVVDLLVQLELFLGQVLDEDRVVLLLLLLPDVEEFLHALAFLLPDYHDLLRQVLHYKVTLFLVAVLHALGYIKRIHHVVILL